MHKVIIPQSVIDEVVKHRGREHVFDDLDPAKTALVVADMQNGFMMKGVAHALCEEAVNIVPNINRIAAAVRKTGGTVVQEHRDRGNAAELVGESRDGWAREDRGTL